MKSGKKPIEGELKSRLMAFKNAPLGSGRASILNNITAMIRDGKSSIEGNTVLLSILGCENFDQATHINFEDSAVLQGIIDRFAALAAEEKQKKPKKELKISIPPLKLDKTSTQKVDTPTGGRSFDDHMAHEAVASRLKKYHESSRPIYQKWTRGGEEIKGLEDKPMPQDLLDTLQSIGEVSEHTKDYFKENAKESANFLKIVNAIPTTGATPCVSFINIGIAGDNGVTESICLIAVSGKVADQNRKAIIERLSELTSDAKQVSGKYVVLGSFNENYHQKLKTLIEQVSLVDDSDKARFNEYDPMRDCAEKSYLSMLEKLYLLLGDKMRVTSAVNYLIPPTKDKTKPYSIPCCESCQANKTGALIRLAKAQRWGNKFGFDLTQAMDKSLEMGRLSPVSHRVESGHAHIHGLFASSTSTSKAASTVQSSPDSSTPSTPSTPASSDGGGTKPKRSGKKSNG